MSAFWIEFHRKQYWSLHFSLAVSIITVWKSLTLSLYLIAIISPFVKQANDLSAFSRLYTNMLRKTLHISLTLKHRRCSQSVIVCESIVTVERLFCFIFKQWSIFFRVYISSSKHEEGWKNLRQLCKPEMQSRVCLTFENSPTPQSVQMRLCKQGKSALLLL